MHRLAQVKTIKIESVLKSLKYEPATAAVVASAASSASAAAADAWVASVACLLQKINIDGFTFNRKYAR